MKKILSLAAFSLISLAFSLSAQAQLEPWLEDDYGLPTGTTSDIIGAIVTWALGIFGFLGIIAFIISGVLYLTAAGDADQEKKAKKAMTMGVIGVVVGLVGFVVIQAVDLMLRAETVF